MGIINFQTFLIASFLFIISPGIDTVFILNKSIAQGKKAGIYSTLGITTGVLVHTSLAAVGLSLLLAQSAIVFSVIKYLGAAYLLYLGIATLITNETLVKEGPPEARISLKRIYASAVLTNTLNPKVALFFLAFFPQFIQSGHLSSAFPFLILGITYAVTTLTWFLLLTHFSSSFSSRLKQKPLLGIWIQKIAACAFILMGLKVAFTKQ